MNRYALLITVITLTTVQLSGQKNYVADVASTQIIWNAKKVTGEHTGTIALKDGWLTLKGSAITGGEFNIDMTTIKDSDLKDDKMKGMLEGHLKSDDFFGVEKYPLSRLVITGSTVQPDGKIAVKGELTIKGKTNPVEFTATPEKKGEETVYNTVITVDRTLYDVRYGSGKFFANLGDKVIYDEFTLTVTLVVSKK